MCGEEPCAIPQWSARCLRKMRNVAAHPKREQPSFRSNRNCDGITRYVTKCARRNQYEQAAETACWNLTTLVPFDIVTHSQE